MGWSQPPPPFTSVQTSRVPCLGAAETWLKSAAKPWPPSVRTVQGASSVPLERPNSNVRSRETGICDTSGFGINVPGTWLRSGFVHGHYVAQKAVQLENVEKELPIGIPGLVSHHQVNVVIEVAP